MTLHAGHCTSCDAEIFRFVAHGRSGERVMLYPLPTSVYGRRRYASGSEAPGIGYCSAHVPTLGDAGIVGVDLAGSRYAYWYTRAFGQHLRAWLADHCELPEHEVEAVMAQWAEDCKATEGVPCA